MMKTTVAENGFEGILLPGDGSKTKVVIVMSGSNGGMKITKQCAQFYDRNGIPALALALFATKGTQPNLDRVPVEYVENAVSWLNQQGYQRIGIDGMSKGSEMALLAASKLPMLSCVIARVPSHFISEGLTGHGMRKEPSGTSCWSYQGESLPFAPYKIRTFNVPEMLKREKELHMIDFNREKDICPESLIPIENIKAPVLLLSSKQDTVWPSCESAAYMDKRLDEFGFPWQHRHIAYEHMSHAMITELPAIYKLAFKAERNDPDGCRADREDLKRQLLTWVNDVWEK